MEDIYYEWLAVALSSLMAALCLIVFMTGQTRRTSNSCGGDNTARPRTLQIDKSSVAAARLAVARRPSISSRRVGRVGGLCKLLLPETPALYLDGLPRFTMARLLSSPRNSSALC
jgi:hypothetical protein